MNGHDSTTPAGIFLKTIARIESRLKKAGRPRAFKDVKVANAMRGELYELEGWAKIHRHWPDKKERKTFEQMRSQSKSLENAFGFLDVAIDLESDLRAKGQTDLAQIFIEKSEQARHELKYILKSQDWFKSDDSEGRIEKMRSQISAIDWPSPSAQFDFFIRAITKDLTDLGIRYREDLKPKLLKPIYDRKILENDLHKFRRQLRWFSMYFHTANGLIGLGPVSDRLTAEKKNLIVDYAQNPFAILPHQRGPRAPQAKIDTVAFYELTRLIELLGPIKDRAQRYFQIRDSLIEKGESEAKATERARLLYGDAPTETPLETQKLMAEYERLKPLSYLAQSLSGS
jgi:hypothetical protein